RARCTWNASSASLKSGAVSSTMQPSDWSTARAGSSARVTLASTGNAPPRSGLHATRAFLKSRASGRAKTLPGSACVVGERGSGPVIAESNSAASSTVRAIGPSDHNVSHAFGNGQLGTRPGVGRKTTTLQKLAGLRSDEPRSEPSANGNIPLATATAAPPDEPPQVFERS